MQFHGISFMHPYKQSGRWQDALDTKAWHMQERNTINRMGTQKRLKYKAWYRPKSYQRIELNKVADLNEICALRHVSIFTRLSFIC
jgi:hypothetical protein